MCYKNPNCLCIPFKTYKSRLDCSNVNLINDLVYIRRHVLCWSNSNVGVLGMTSMQKLNAMCQKSDLNLPPNVHVVKRQYIPVINSHWNDKCIKHFNYMAITFYDLISKYYNTPRLNWAMQKIICWKSLQFSGLTLPTFSIQNNDGIQQIIWFQQ